MCKGSKDKLSPSNFTMESGFPKQNSVLVELSASDNLDAFRSEVQEKGFHVDEAGFWYGRRIGSKKMGFEERTPLMIAAMFGSTKVLKYIIQSGKADVNRSCGSDKVTALHCATAGGSTASLEVVKLLLDASADANCVNANGNKPIDLIAPALKSPCSSRRKTMEMLLKGDMSVMESDQIANQEGDQQKFPSPQLSKDGSEKKEYPIDISLPDINNGIYGTDEFRMYTFKVKPCSRAYSHDWTECPFVHPGENARRRDPRKYPYSCVPCPEFRKGSCQKGDVCEYAHGVFESWLHPAQYRTRLCKDETGCTRKVCFFAHRPEELRPVYASTGSAMPSPRSMSVSAADMASPLALGSSPMSQPTTSTPPMSPLATSSSPKNGALWQNKVNLTPPALQLPGSRLKSALSARDLDLEMELLGLDSHSSQQQKHQHQQQQQQQLWDEISRLSSPKCYNNDFSRIGELKPTRTFHQIPSLWNRSSSTHALGNILQPIGCSGLLVFLLRKFVDYFSNLNVESEDHVDGEAQVKQCPPYSLVNHAFAVSVGKVVEGYMCALDTLYASVGLRRSSCSSSVVGCLNSVVYSELTLLEFYLHTKELRTQIEALTNLCNLYQFSSCFSVSSLEELITKANLEFCNFYRGGDLLSYLYTQLQVADPAHRPLLKFLFLRTCEPYCGFIRSWIFKAEISDPYKEFVVEYADSLSPNQHGKADISIDFPLATIREQDGVSVPCFLKDVLIPLVRAGQQLQVLVKLLELCTFVATNDHTYEGFLPCWTGFSGNCPYYSSPLTFIKGNVEAMLLSRDRYYRRMQEKLENLSAKLEFRYQQVVRPGTLPVLLDNGGRSSTNPGLFALDDNFIPSPTNDKRESNGVHDLDSGELSARDGLSDLTDSYESSECSFDSTSAEQNVSEQIVELPNHIVGLEQKYLSALSFSMSMPVDNLQKPHVREESCHIVSDQSRLCEGRDALAHSHHKGVFTSQISVPIKPKESNLSAMSDVQFADCLSDKDWPEGGLFESYSAIDEEYKDGRRSHPMDSPSKVNERILEALKEGTSYFRKRVGTNSALIEEAYGKDQPHNVTYTSSDLFTLQQWKVNSHNNFLSMNPMLTKNNLLHLKTKPGERYGREFGHSLPCFEFSLIKDPFKVCLEKLPAGLMDSNASVTSVKSDRFGKQDFGGDSVSIDKTKVSDSLPFSNSKDHDQENANLTNVSGGSCWESLLGRFSDTVINRVEDHGQSLSEIFEIPLDFIIDKCLLQEIMLQYKYVSKLTIKLLEEGFDLQEHLLALRRYHFMELADWADLFIMSLWHHKWCVTEADHRLSEIQGFLESSVQRSSCERDPHKDRLFVYMKGHDAMPLSASVIGVHSFNFLGLGYRVDWPISIILSPSALKMYAEIFSFLIQVKLAIFSLTDVWRQLKDLVHSISQNNNSEQNEREVSHFNALVKMRHQVNHFVSTLQQYVESQLSHVSWCRFLYSLKHKVKDMMDLQSVHLAYLIDSLDICFLSDETRPIARIIESILQCALDFRSCLTGEMWDAGTSQGNLMARLSGINISQVVVIKQMFDKNMKELHLCYLKSPKHGKFGLSHFWEYLNYNKYYSDVGNEMAYYAFSV